jgi:hypothetical protein
MENKIKKIFNKMEVDEAKNQARLQRAKFDLQQKEIYQDINKISKEARIDKKVMRSGLIIYLLTIIGLIASTSIIISVGLKEYKGHSFAFIAIFIFVELVLYQSYAHSTNIKERFNRYYGILKFMQLGLLFVLIFYNYSFFSNYVSHKSVLLQIATFVLCFLVEFSIMNLVGLANDMRTLNYTYSNDIQEDTSIIKMLLFNLFFKTRINALRQYKKNVRQLKMLNVDKELEIEPEQTKIYIVQKEIETEGEQQEQIETEEIKQIEEPKTDPQEEKIELFQPKVLNIEEIETYFNKMIEMSDKGIAKGVRKTATMLDMETGTATRIFEKLKDKQYIKTIGIQTKILKDKFNKDDFREDEDNG